MPVYEYECTFGHRTERVVIRATANEPRKRTRCEAKACDGSPCPDIANLVPSRTGKPILKAGVGGFYAPNAR